MFPTKEKTKERRSKPKMFNLKKINKFRKNVKAISPVISVLLMIAVAVVASLVAYAWVMGYMNFQTAKTGQAIQIQSVQFTGTAVSNVYVQNVGDGVVTLDNNCLYVEGLQYAVSIDDTSLSKGETATLTVTTSGFASGDMITIKVTTEGGTYSEISKLVP